MHQTVASSKKRRTFAIGYFVALLAFALVYYGMPDTDFYHASIQHEPNSIGRLNRLRDELDAAFKMELFKTGPYGLSVNFTPVYDISFPAKDTIIFSVGYYYYKLGATDPEWQILTSHCGPSERPKNFYRRSALYHMKTAASYGGQSITVRSETQLNECDQAVLQLHYRSIEPTSEGFQAMLPITPELNSLLQAVSEEQLGYAPRAFSLDRFSRMFYFSVSAITTSGFGDILPLTTRARLLVSLESIVGITLLGFFLDAVAKS